MLRTYSRQKMCGFAPGIPSPGQGSPTPSSSNIFFTWCTKPLTVHFLLSMQGRPCSRALLTLLDPFQKLHHRPHFSFPGLLEPTDSRQTHFPHWPLAASIYFHIHTVALRTAPAPLTTCPAAQLGWGRLQTLLPPWLWKTSIHCPVQSTDTAGMPDVSTDVSTSSYLILQKTSASFPQAVALDGRKKDDRDWKRRNGERKGRREGGKKRAGEITDLDPCYFLFTSSQLISFNSLLYKIGLNEINLFAFLGTGTPCVASAGFNSPCLSFPRAEMRGGRHHSGHFRRIYPSPYSSLPGLLERITVGRTAFSSGLDKVISKSLVLEKYSVISSYND